jgi:hypothetical protein
MRVSYRPSKEELSTWLGVGTFYLAPTGILPGILTGILPGHFYFALTGILPGRSEKGRVKVSRQGGGKGDHC